MRLIRIIAFSLIAAGFCQSVFAHSGHTVWGPWRFDWEVRDKAGLGLRNVYYDNQKILYKATLPVIRVRYKNDVCGPYADRIYWSLLKKISNCGNAKVCQKSFTSNGRNWLEIGVYARIGSYHIYQAWYLSHDGWILPTAWSKGLQCDADHDHHSYWALDFDIAGASNDQVFVRNDGAANEGWGPGWHKYTTETNAVKNLSTNRVWFVRDNGTSRGVWIFPGRFDGTANSFSSLDVGVRRWHSGEHGEWTFGAWGELGYQNGENVEETDIILWYVGHLHHEAEEGEDHWHWVGPSMFYHRE